MCLPCQYRSSASALKRPARIPAPSANRKIDPLVRTARTVLSDSTEKYTEEAKERIRPRTISQTL